MLQHPVFIQSQLQHVLGQAESLIVDFSKFSVALEESERGRSCHVEFNNLQHFDFQVNYLLAFVGPVSDILKVFYFRSIDLFIFTCYQHRCDTYKL